MFNLGGRQPRRTQGDESTRQPLLDEDRNSVLFEAEGDEEEDGMHLSRKMSKRTIDRRGGALSTSRRKYVS